MYRCLLYWNLLLILFYLKFWCHVTNSFKSLSVKAEVEPLIFCLFLWSFCAVYTLFSRKIHLRGLNINEVSEDVTLRRWRGAAVQHMLCYTPLFCSPSPVTSRRRRHTTLNSCCHVSSFISGGESKYFLSSNLPHLKPIYVAYGVIRHPCTS